MTEQQRKAMELALEALEANQPINYCMNNNGERFPIMQKNPFKFECNTKAITAIKEALAQPEQEPTSVTYKEVADTMNCLWHGGMEAKQYAEVLENKKLYTSPQPAQQEPVAKPFAWANTDDLSADTAFRWCEIGDHKTPVYTTQPQRTWVGLTDREKSNLWLESRAAIPRFYTYASLVEAKLKAKNT